MFGWMRGSSGDGVSNFQGFVVHGVTTRSLGEVGRGESYVKRVGNCVSRIVNPIISVRFSGNGRRGVALPHVRSTVRVAHPGKGVLVIRIRRRVKRGAIHAMTVSAASKLGEKVRTVSRNSPVAVPINSRMGKHLVGMAKGPVSKVARLSGGKTLPVRHRPPGFRSLAADHRILCANVGIVSLLRPCSGKNGVNLFKKTNMKGAILVVRLVGGVTGGGGKFSIFTNINRHAHRKGSLLHRVVRSKIVHCNRRFGGDVRTNR